jgi:hypothetical protein
MSWEKAASILTVITAAIVAGTWGFRKLAIGEAISLFSSCRRGVDLLWGASSVHSHVLAVR